MHTNFSLKSEFLERHVDHARQHPGGIKGAEVLERIRPEAPLDPLDLALLWHAPIATEAIFAKAHDLHDNGVLRLETFSPLYLTNTCDAECKMCGMRQGNDKLKRETAVEAEVSAQLQLLMHRGMQAVALLTGEYRGKNRTWAMRYVNQALRETQRLGFRHVLINVGSIDENEFDTLFEGIERDEKGALRPRLTMSTFQETYSPVVYRKFMGSSSDNPRADFERRLVNFDRARRAGMRSANPGVLLGLNPDIAYEITAMALHTQHLLDQGMEVYLSVPRLRRVAGGANLRAVSDDDFVRAVSLLTLSVPQGRIVLTTRETQTIQRRLAPIIGVISAGSAAVAPYTSDGARFDLDASQFEVIDQRPFEAVLADHRADGWQIANFEPPSL